MHRPFIAFVAALPLVLASFVSAGQGAKAPSQAQPAPPAKVTICHKTSSDTNSFRRITVSSKAFSTALRGHLRHTGDAIVIGTAACPSPSLTPSPTNTPPAKIEICHKTGSKKNPYRRIMVSSRAITNPNSQSGNILRGHMRHAGDILMPGATACPSGTNGQSNQAVKLTADLTPIGGATGTGSATFTIRVAKSELCYTLNVSNLGSSVTAAHIHRGSTGDVVVPLAAPTTGSSSGCVDVAKALLREIVASPGAFYVNVHTDAFPNGQVRGDLSK
jgi:CHRD domain